MDKPGAQPWQPVSATSPGVNMPIAFPNAEIETLFSQVSLEGGPPAGAPIAAVSRIPCDPKFDHGCFSFEYNTTNKGLWFNEKLPFAFQPWVDSSKRPKWFKCDEVLFFLSITSFLLSFCFLALVCRFSLVLCVRVCVMYESAHLSKMPFFALTICVFFIWAVGIRPSHKRPLPITNSIISNTNPQHCGFSGGACASQ